MNRIERVYSTIGLLIALVLMIAIGIWATLTIPSPSWPVWLMIGPLSVILVVAIWGVWKW